MKLMDLVKNQSVIEKVKNSPVPPGKLFQVRKAIKGYIEELTQWEELKIEYFKNHGEEDGKGGLVITDNEKMKEYVDWANKVLTSEIKKTNIVLEEADLEKMELSVSDLEGLISIGLFQEN